jgi:hypothetical protein
VFTTSGTYAWSFVTQTFRNGQQSHGGDRKTFEVMTSTLPIGTIGSVASLVTLDNDDICIILDQHTRLYLYSGSSL